MHLRVFNFPEGWAGPPSMLTPHITLLISGNNNCVPCSRNLCIAGGKILFQTRENYSRFTKSHTLTQSGKTSR